ncbi:MAG: hypothetical protein ACQEQM_05720 [Thermoplasmatota archaeon]
MAKRKKRDKEEEDDYEYEFPEFDRKEYMLDELRKGKCVYISVALAPLFSILAHYVFIYSGHQAILGFLIGLTGLGLLKTLFQIAGVELEELGKKEWALSGAMYLFTFLAVWVILMNPPFSDFTAPTSNEIELEFEQDGEIVAHDNVTSGEEYDVTVIATITDNTEVDHDNIRIFIDGDWYEMEWQTDTHEYHVTFENTVVEDRSMSVRISMRDINDNESEVSHSLPFNFTP